MSFDDVSGVPTIQGWVKSEAVNTGLSSCLLGYSDSNQKLSGNTFMMMFLIFISTFGTELSYFLSECCLWKLGVYPCQPIQFQIPSSFPQVQAEGSEGGKGNGGSGGKRDRESPNQACHLIIASILLLLFHSLINFSGRELLS